MTLNDSKMPPSGGIFFVLTKVKGKGLALGGAKWCGNTKLPPLAKNVISRVYVVKSRIFVVSARLSS